MLLWTKSTFQSVFLVCFCLPCSNECDACDDNIWQCPANLLYFCFNEGRCFNGEWWTELFQSALVKWTRHFGGGLFAMMHYAKSIWSFERLRYFLWTSSLLIKAAPSVTLLCETSHHGHLVSKLDLEIPDRFSHGQTGFIPQTFGVSNKAEPKWCFRSGNALKP